MVILSWDYNWQIYCAIIMIMGYGIIAVPTGIVSAEMAQKEEDLIQIHNHVQTALNLHTKTMLSFAIAVVIF